MKYKYELNSINYLLFDATFWAYKSSENLIVQAGGQQASLEDKAQAVCWHFIEIARIHTQEIHSCLKAFLVSQSAKTKTLNLTN